MSVSLYNSSTGQLQTLAGIPVDLLNAKQDKMQFATMPTASSTNVGQIVQYTGTTDANYTNGYFYRCVSDGESTPTYSWEAVTQEATEAVFTITITNNSGTLTADKTPDEVAAAYAAGTPIQVKARPDFDYIYAPLVSYAAESSQYRYYNFSVTNKQMNDPSDDSLIIYNYHLTAENTGGVWAWESIYGDSNELGKEELVQDVLELKSVVGADFTNWNRETITSYSGNSYTFGPVSKNYSVGDYILLVSEDVKWRTVKVTSALTEGQSYTFNVTGSTPVKIADVYTQLNELDADNKPATFNITLTGTTGDYSVDKTTAEVLAAYNSGQQINLVHYNRIIPLLGVTTVSSQVIYAFSNWTKTNTLKLVSNDYLLTTNAAGTDWDNINLTVNEANITQVGALPTPSQLFSNRIIQSTGDGYFYQCVNDDGTYSWERIDVQPNSAGSFIITATPPVNPSDAWTVDKTPAEVEEAYAAGKIIILKAIVGVNSAYTLSLFKREDTILNRRSFRFESMETKGTVGEGTTAIYLDGGYANLVYTISDDTTWSTIVVLQSELPWPQTDDFSHSHQSAASDLGVVVQYIGTTDVNYTHGYFYECVSNGSGGTTWQRIDVQPASESDLFTITLTEEDDEYVIDKTVAEVLAAYNAGKSIEVKTNVYFEDEELHLPLFDVYHIDGTTTYSWIFAALNGGPLSSQITQFVVTLPTDSDDDDETWGDITANTVVKDTYVWSTMQTAAVGYTDKVVQYVGATDANYTKGHFYTCVQGGTAPDYTYSWEEIVLGRTSLSALDDTTIANPVDGEPLVYNNTTGKWVNGVGMVKPTEITWANYQLLTEEQKASKRWLIIDYPDTGGSGGPAVFTITLTGDGDTTPYSVDKTPEEVEDALAAGKVVQMNDGSILCYQGAVTVSTNKMYLFSIDNVVTNDLAAGHNVTLVAATSDMSSWTTINVSRHSMNISGKADKVSGATNGDFASLDANGNLADSGKKASDFATASHNQASDTINAMTGYSKASTAAAIATTDTLNEAIGKLEKTLDGKGTSNLAIGTTAGTACEGNDSRLSDSRTPTAHNQAASTITEGTLAGRVQANATAAGTLANAQVRNITISTTDLTAGTSSLATGSVYIVYEA